MTPDMAMIWFGVIIAMNLQTSFLTPPFGFALFFLRSVAAKFDYKDRVTGRPIKAVTTKKSTRAPSPLSCCQLIMVAAIIAFPSLVVGRIGQRKGLAMLTKSGWKWKQPCQILLTHPTRTDMPEATGDAAARTTAPRQPPKTTPCKVLQDRSRKTQ